MPSILTRVGIAAACIVASCFAPSSVAASSPFFYVSFHGGKNGVNTVASYDLTGALVNSAVTQGDSNANSLRSGVIMADGSLLMTNAHKTDSRLVLYSQCDQNGNRNYVQDFSDSNLAHPYGLALGVDADAGDLPVVWATNQDSWDLVQFTVQGATPSQVQQFGQQELRSIAFDAQTNLLYIANEDANATLVYDTNNNEMNATMAFNNIATPIGLYIDQQSRLIFIGSNGSPSAVYAYDLDTHQLVQTYTNAGLQHPAGLVTVEDSLYVISQTAGTLLQFDIKSGAFVSTLISSFPDTPEQIWLSDC